MTATHSDPHKLKLTTTFLAVLLGLAVSAIPVQAEALQTATRSDRRPGDKPIVLACNQEVNINCQRRCFISSAGQGKSAAEIRRDCDARCKRSSGC
jgi:hypothetical protein